MNFHISQFLSPGRKEFVKGTLLTGAGLFCRILGFYRIYMSRTIGAEGLGLYNMIHPLFSIAFAVCAGSIQTALSQYIAASREKGPAVFKCGLFLSLSLSVIPLFAAVERKMFLAGNILSEPQAARYLPVLAVSVPFACLHACINGYYYGMNKAHIPSFSQIAEQVIRMGAVWLLVGYLEKNGKSVTVGLAVEGHLIGEMASAAFTFLALFLVPPQRKERQNETLIGETGRQRREQKRVEKENVLGDNAVFANLGPILILALPLMGNRLVLNLLGSAGSYPDPQPPDRLWSDQQRSIIHIWSTYQHGASLYPVSFGSYELHGSTFTSIGCQGTGGKRRKPHFYHGHTVFPVQLLHGYPVHRSFYPVWQKPWHDHFP